MILFQSEKFLNLKRLFHKHDSLNLFLHAILQSIFLRLHLLFNLNLFHIYLTYNLVILPISKCFDNIFHFNSNLQFQVKTYNWDMAFHLLFFNKCLYSNQN